MKYFIYSYEIIDGDIDFIERIKKESEKDTVEEAFDEVIRLDKEWEEKKEREKLFDSIVHLVYDENDKIVNGYPGLFFKEHPLFVNRS